MTIILQVSLAVGDVHELRHSAQEKLLAIKVTFGKFFGKVEAAIFADLLNLKWVWQKKKHDSWLSCEEKGKQNELFGKVYDRRCFRSFNEAKH